MTLWDLIAGALDEEDRQVLLAVALEQTPEPTPAQVMKAAKALGDLYPDVSYLGVVR